MSDAADQNPKRPLSEIGHLFLSSVRQRQTNGAQRPQRTPPPSQSTRHVSIDMTADEWKEELSRSAAL